MSEEVYEKSQPAERPSVSDYAEAGALWDAWVTKDRSIQEAEAAYDAKVGPSTRTDKLVSLVRKYGVPILGALAAGNALPPGITTVVKAVWTAFTGA